MYIMDTRRIRKKLQALEETEMMNTAIWLLFEGPFHNEAEIDDLDAVSDAVKKFRALPKKERTGRTADQILLQTMLYQIAFEEIEAALILGEAHILTLITIMAQAGHVYHKKEFNKNDYLKTFRFDEPVICGPYTLTKRHYFQNQLVLDQPPIVDDDGLIIPRPAAFADTYAAPCLQKVVDHHNTFVDIIYPYTIQTAQDIIEEAAGDVLLLGCGLGYVPFHLSACEDVKHITIIEPDPDFRLLFEQHLLPKFSAPENVTLITESPETYLQSVEDGTYDFIFADCFQSEDDTPRYLNLRRICQKFQKTTVLYRAEEFLLYKLREQMACLLLSTFYPELAKTLETRCVQSPKTYGLLSRLTKKLGITKDKEIDNLLTVDGILKLMET